MKSISFLVPDPPAPWHVFTRWDKSDSKARLKAFQAHVKAIATQAMAGRPPHDGPIALTMDFYRAIPERCPKPAKAREKWLKVHLLMTPDHDAYAKGCQDAMNKVCYYDDKQVIWCQSSKSYKGEGETVITVEFL